MAGSNSISGDESIFFSDNASYDGTARGGKMVADGQLWIGATASNRANNGGHVRLGTLTAGTGVTITNGPGTITIGLTGSGIAVEHLTGNSGGQLNPDGSNNFNILGASAAAGTSPVTSAGVGSTLTVKVQTSQALAAADATKIGLSNFDSTAFSVAATGFVTLSTTGVLRTLTGDTGTATPVAGNILIQGGPGVTTQASGATVQINAVSFTDTTGTTLVKNNGYYATAAGTYTLPAAPGQGDLVIVYCDTAGAVAVTGNTGQFIRVGSLISSSAGTATSTSIGDTLSLRYRVTGATWTAVSTVGTWLMA